MCAILYRLSPQLGLLEAIRNLAHDNPDFPRLFVLEGGANDLGIIDGSSDVGQIAAGMGQCMDIIHEMFPLAHVTVFGSLPSGSRNPENALSEEDLLRRAFEYEALLQSETNARPGWSSLCSQVCDRLLRMQLQTQTSFPIIYCHKSPF